MYIIIQSKFIQRVRLASYKRSFKINICYGLIKHSTQKNASGHKYEFQHRKVAIWVMCVRV